MNEELGLTETDIENIEYMYLVIGLIGIGFGPYPLVDTNLSSDEIIHRRAGRDRSIEIEHFVTVPVTREHMEDAILNPEFSDHVCIALRKVAESRGIQLRC